MREDVMLFATALWRRYQGHAVDYATAWAHKLKICGDHEGHRVWTAVADLIRAMEAPQADAGTAEAATSAGGATDGDRAARGH